MRDNRYRLLFEVGVIVALVSCSSQPKPAPRSLQRPVLLVEPGFDLVGYWLREGVMDGSAFLLSYPLDGRYTVRFSSAGCMGSEVRELGAHFDGGYLYLSEPVTEYGGQRLDRLALFQLGDKTMLVPESDLAEFQAIAARRAEGTPGELAYVRLSAIP